MSGQHHPEIATNFGFSKGLVLYTLALEDLGKHQTSEALYKAARALTSALREISEVHDRRKFLQKKKAALKAIENLNFFLNLCSRNAEMPDTKDLKALLDTMKAEVEQMPIATEFSSLKA